MIIRSRSTFVLGLLSLVGICEAQIFVQAQPQPSRQMPSSAMPEPHPQAPNAAQAAGQNLTPGLGVDVPLPALPPAAPKEWQLTLDQAIKYGMEHSPQILAAHYNVEGARANYVGQRLPANPTIGFGTVNNQVSTGQFGNPANYPLYVPVETSGKLRWRTDQSKNQWLQSKSDFQTTSNTVRESVADAYIVLQVANRGLIDEQEAYADARKLRDLTLKQFQAGGAPQTNAIRTQVAFTQESANMVTAINAVRDARANLNVQLGRNATDPIDAADPLAFTPIHPRLEELEAQALKNRPELQSAEYNRRSLSANVGLQRAAGYPDLIFGTDLHAIGEGNVEVGFAFPIDLGSIRGAVQQAQKQVKAQQAVQTQLKQSVELDVSSAFDALSTAEQTVDAYQNGILPQSVSLFERITQGYTLGANTVLDLLDAQSTLRSVRIAYYTAIGNYRQAMAQLEHATGQAIPAFSSVPIVNSPPPVK